jgi:hypothetical protein
MRTSRGVTTVKMIIPDGKVLAFCVDGTDFQISPLSPKDWERLPCGDHPAADILAAPVYYLSGDDRIDLWPCPDREYELFTK